MKIDVGPVVDETEKPWLNPLDEKALVRKLDWRILPILGLMYTLSFIDRVNIGLASLYNMEADLNLTPSQYAVSLSIFFLGYMSCEIPSNYMLKKLSPPIWFAILLIAWGGITMIMSTTINFQGLVVARVVLGIAESGLFPGIIFYLSFWYPRKEQGTRVAIICSASLIAASMGGFIAYAIHNLDKVGGLASWRWLFLLEGLPTVLLGLTIWFILPSRPQEAKFLTLIEKDQLVKRLEASHVDLNIKQFDINQVKQVIKDPKLYLFMLINFGILLPGNAMSLFLPTLVHNLGFDSVISTLLSVPPNLFGAIVSILIASHSDHKIERGHHLIFTGFIGIIGFILIQCTENIPIRYVALMIGNAGINSSISLVLSWLNNNLMGSTIAAIAPPAVIMSGCIGGILAGQLYKKADAPTFILSHNINIASLLLSIICAFILRTSMKRSNQQDDIQSITENESPNSFRYIL